MMVFFFFWQSWNDSKWWKYLHELLYQEVLHYVQQNFLRFMSVNKGKIFFSHLLRKFNFQKVLSTHYCGLLGVQKYTVKCKNQTSIRFIKYQIYQNMVSGLLMLPWCSTKQFSTSSHLDTVYGKKTKFIMDYRYTDRGSVGGSRGMVKYIVFFYCNKW